MKGVSATTECSKSLQRDLKDGFERIASKKFSAPDVQNFCQGIPKSFILGQVVLFTVIVADILMTSDCRRFIPTSESIPRMPPISSTNTDALMLLLGAGVAAGVASHSWHAGHCTPCLPASHFHRGSKNSSVVDQTYTTTSDDLGRRSSVFTEERTLVSDRGACGCAGPCISHCNRLCDPCLSHCDPCLPSHRESHLSISHASQPGLLDYFDPCYWLGDEPCCGSRHRRESCHTGFFERCNPYYWIYGKHGHHGHHHVHHPCTTTSSVITETYDDGVVQSKRESRVVTRNLGAKANVPFKLFANLNPLNWFSKKSEGDGDDQGTNGTKASSYVKSTTKVTTGVGSSKKNYSTSIADDTTEHKTKPSQFDAFRDDGLKWLLVLNIVLFSVLFILFLVFPLP